MSNGSVAELRQEQDYFDQAMDDHEESFRSDQIEGGGVGTAAERRAMQKHRDSKVRLSKDDAVASRRYVLDSGETYYIGKVSIMNADGDMSVINWQSKMGAKLYQSTARDPNGVVSRRQFHTTGNRIDQFSDTLYQELAQKVSSLEDELRADPVLRTSLEAGRDGKMRDIVQTIQASQDKLIRADKDQLLVIQGGPGTGKTAVALHRASWLLYSYPHELTPDDVLVVGPNPSFTKYIQHVLPGLGDVSVKQTSVVELLTHPGIHVQGTDQESVAHLKGSEVMAEVIAQNLSNRIKAPTTSIRVRKQNSGAYYIIEPVKLRDYINQLRQGPYSRGRKQVRAKILEECGKQLLTQAAAKYVEQTVDARSLDNVLDRIWPRVSPQVLIREMLGSRSRLAISGQGLLSTNELSLLFRRSSGTMAKEPWTTADMALIDEADFQLNSDSRRWGHIIIDEAQDLTPMQLRAIRRRSRTGSMTVVGDLAQSTGAFARDSWTDIQAILQSRLPSNLKHLEHGYRVPREVYNIAARLLPQAAKNVRPASIIRESGSKPRLFNVVASQMAREVAKQASHHSSKGRFVGVIAPPEQFDVLRSAFRSEGVKFSDSANGELGNSINLVSPEMSKGLEFDAVVIADPQAILDMDEKWGARLLYIAITRTTHLLDVIAPIDEIPSILIGEHFQTISIAREDEALEPHSFDTESIVDDLIDAATAADSTEDSPSNETVTAPQSNQGEAGFTAIQQEMIAQNARYLTNLLNESFKPGMAKAILESALEQIGVQTDIN